jgi:hypothetical protein
MKNIVSFVGGHFHVKQYTQMLQNNLPMCVKTFLRETSCALFNNGLLVCHVYTLLICLVSFVCVRGTICWSMRCEVSFVCVRGTICWAMRCEVSIVALTKNILTGNELCFVQQRAAGVSHLRKGQNQRYMPSCLLLPWE